MNDTSPQYAEAPRLFPDEWEQPIRNFEHAWLDGSHPDLADFLPDDAAARPTILLQLVHADLEFRLKRNEPARVEEYLHRFPELLDHSAEVAQLILAEFRLRRRCEPLLTPSEYERRFPEWRQSLQALTKLEHDGHDTQIFVAASPIPTSSRDELDSTPPAKLAQTEWSDFEIREELGRGGMAVVHLAWQHSLERLVAIKTLHPQIVRDPKILGRFRQEAIAAAQLLHPHIVQVMAYGEVSETPFYVMEYVSGGTLAQQLTGKPWPAQEAARLVETAARAVHVAHERQMLHRDLKPSNILLTIDGVPKIGDFGLAKRLDQAADHTSFGALLGTPSYMSPEQARGTSAELTVATDVYSLGAILYELLTGRPPVVGESSAAILAKLRTADLVAPHSLAPHTPNDLETICLKSLRRNPADRYRTADELADDLRRYLDGRCILAKRPTSWSKLSLWCRRQPLLVSLSAAMVVLLALLGAWLPEVRSSGQKSLEAQSRLDDTRRHFYDAHNALRSCFNETAIKSELIRARQYYSGFLNQHTSDAALVVECAISQYALGKISEREQDIEAAINWWRSADELFNQIDATVLREHDEGLSCFIHTQLDLAGELFRRQNYQAALLCYEKAQTQLEQRLIDKPGEVIWQHRLAYCRTNQYRLAGNALDAVEVLRRCEAAVETWRSFVDAKIPFPNLLQQRTDSFPAHLAMGLRNCGRVLIFLERNEEAITRFQEVLAIDQYRRQHPEEFTTSEYPERDKERRQKRVREAHDGLAKSHYLWGQRRLNDGQPDLSVANFLESIHHWAIVVESGSATSLQRSNLALCHFHLAVAHRRQEHHSQALAEYPLAAALWELLLADQELKGFNRELAESHLQEAHVEIKKIQEATK